MKTRILDSSAKRMAMVVAILAGLILIGAAAYTFFGSVESQPANGLKIIAAAHAYATGLQQRHLPIPKAVSLQILIDQGLLKPADIGPFQGLDANIFLTTSVRSGNQFVLMRVHMPDDTDLLLLEDGSSQRVKR
jgi:hypothetical protein